MNISDTMAPAIAAQKNYRKMKAEAEEQIPFPTIQQPTADLVNSAGAQQVPTSMSEFYGRGGLTGTARQMVNSIAAKRKQKELRGEYERLLEAGERGADAAYQNEIRLNGEGVVEYLPEKTLFYDEDGVFMPHKYALALYTGVKKFRADQATAAQRQAAGTILSGAESPLAANAAMLGSNIDPTQYEKSIGTIQTQEQRDKAKFDAEKSKLEAEWYPDIQRANIREKEATATKTAQGGSYTEKLSAFNNSKSMLLKQLGDVDRIYSDPVAASDPNAILQAEKRRDQINKAIEKVDAQIARLETEKYGREITPPPKDDVSEGAASAAREIIAGMERMPPKGMTSTKDELGAPSYQRGKRPPDAAAYNAELANRTVRYLETKGIPGFPATAVAELLKNNSLEDIINDILISTQGGQAAGGAPDNAGTIQSGQPNLNQIFGGQPSVYDRLDEMKRRGVEDVRGSTGATSSDLERIRQSLNQ